MVYYTAKYMKTLAVLIFVFAFYQPIQAQNENTSIAVAHLSGSEEISLTQNFEFLKSISINFISGNKISPSNLNYTLRYPETGSYMAMSISGFSDPSTESVPEVVMDFDRQTRITFMCFGDIKMARTHILEDTQKDISILNLNAGRLKKTGKSQEILGYKSLEYKLTEGDFKGSVWLTTSLDSGLEKPFDDLGLRYNNSDSDLPSGYIMRVDADNKITQEVMHLSVSNINTNDIYSIDSSAYVTTAAPSE